MRGSGGPPDPVRADHQLGIHTTRAVPLDQLSIQSGNRVHGSRYEPTPFEVLDQMLLGLGLDHPQFHFIDLGSGKGRVLCLAARYPWKSVLGVEFAPELHRIAQDNLRALPASSRRCRELRSTCGDAAELVFPPEPTVLYLFNPFAAPVLSRVLDALETSYLASPAEKLILYYMPVCEDLLARRSFLSPHSGDKNWRIYRAVPPR